MKTYTQEQLDKIIEQHILWLNSDDGSRADLRGADLSSADLSGACLSYADLSSANLSSANLSGANLKYANLRDSYLKYANLRSANLRGTEGDLKFLKSVFLEDYPITYTAEILQIGCQKHSIADWWMFDDKCILEMDGKTALKFWRKYKDFIKMAIELSPAKPTGSEL